MERIIPVRLSFRLPLSADKSVDRFVFAYIVVGRELAIIDTGAAGSQQPLAEALAALGKTPAEVAWVVNTHEHPDHIGGNGFFEEQAHPKFACHAHAVRWIEHLDVQYRERPVYDFYKLTGQAIRVTQRLQDRDEIDFGDGVRLQVLFTPGHSPGSMSLFDTQEGVLISADLLQPVGGLPLYSDLKATRESLRRVLQAAEVKKLYCSHNERPYAGAEIPAAIQSSLDYLDRMDEAVHAAVKHLPDAAAPEEITRESLIRFGMHPPPVMPITIQSIMAHLQ